MSSGIDWSITCCASDDGKTCDDTAIHHPDAYCQFHYNQRIKQGRITGVCLKDCPGCAMWERSVGAIKKEEKHPCVPTSFTYPYPTDVTTLSGKDLEPSFAPFLDRDSIQAKAWCCAKCRVMVWATESYFECKHCNTKLLPVFELYTPPAADEVQDLSLAPTEPRYPSPLSLEFEDAEVEEAADAAAIESAERIPDFAFQSPPRAPRKRARATNECPFCKHGLITDHYCVDDAGEQTGVFRKAGKRLKFDIDLSQSDDDETEDENEVVDLTV